MDAHMVAIDCTNDGYVNCNYKALWMQRSIDHLYRTILTALKGS